MTPGDGAVVLYASAEEQAGNPQRYFARMLSISLR